MSIEIRNLLKEYGDQKAVNNISFKIEKGEIVGFLGPNGAGKSTTMKIITGYMQQTSGEAYVCGINVAEEPLAVKKKVGYLPELNALYYDMYVREYLMFTAEVYKINNRNQRVNDVIHMTGLALESRKKIGQLSKGYKQRVGLAAALIHDPEVLILDEPTSGLDPNQILEIREVIRKQGENKTVLFSSHILQEVEAICDRVLIISKGLIVANDRLQNLKEAAHDKQAVLVEFGTNPGTDHLSALTGVSRVEALSSTQFRLLTKDADQVRREILELALKLNLNIVSLQSENQRLEEIFRSLTT